MDDGRGIKDWLACLDQSGYICYGEQEMDGEVE